MKKLKKFLIALLTIGIVLPTNFGLFFNFHTIEKAKADSPLCGLTLNDSVTTRDGLTVNSDTHTFTLTADMSCSSGNGLVVGEDGITIDGGDHIISGSGDEETAGIDDTNQYEGGFDNVTIRNITVINSYYGVNADGATNLVLEDVALEHNANAAYIYGSSSNIANSSFSSNQMSIMISDCAGDTAITGNQANSNSLSGGILIMNCPGVRVTGNTADSNGLNVSDSVAAAIEVQSSIDAIISENTTNNNRYSSGIGVLYTEGGAENPGVISGNTSNGNYTGISIIDSSQYNLDGNYVGYNMGTGITINNTTNLSFNDNTLLRNGNSILRVGENSNLSYTDNKFLYDFYNGNMLTLAESDRAGNEVGDSIGFAITIKDALNESCNDDLCDVTVNTLPEESLISSIYLENNVEGSFTPTKTGAYSLKASAQDSNGNITTKNYLYFVNDPVNQVGARSDNHKLYFRRKDDPPYPTHGQPVQGVNGQSNTDLGTLLTSAPTSLEQWNCGGWFQLSVDEAPSSIYYPALITGADVNTWWASLNNTGILQLSRFYFGTQDSDSFSPFNSLPQTTSNFKWINSNFDNSDLNWTVDSDENWYGLSMKFTTSAGGPSSISFPAAYPFVAGLGDRFNIESEEYFNLHRNDISNVNFSYAYPTSVKIKSITNPNSIVTVGGDHLNVLSAVGEVGDNNATIILDATGLDSDSDLSNGIDNTGSAYLTIDDYKRPFIGYNTTINSDGTAVLAAEDITGETTINSANMDIEPNAGNIAVNVSQWGTSGNYQRTWTEAGTGVTSASHIISDLAAGSDYVISVNGSVLDTYTAGSDGKIPFDFTPSEYSTKTFSLTKVEDQDTAAPTIGLTSPTVDTFSTSYSSVDISGTASDTGSGLASVTVNGVALSNPSSFSTTVNLATGVNTITIVASDVAGNATTKTLNITKLMPTLTLTTPTELIFRSWNRILTLKGTVGGNEVGVKSVKVRNISQLVKNGQFTAYVTLNSGVNKIDVVVEDNAGNTTTKSLYVSYYYSALARPDLNIIPPAGTTVAKIYSRGTEQNLSSNTAPTITTGLPVFSGLTSPNANVFLEIHSNVINASTKADSDGRWSYTVTEPLEAGSHSVKITIKDTANTTISEASYNFTVENPPAAPQAETKSANDTSTNSNVWVYVGAAFIAIISIGLILGARKKK